MALTIPEIPVTDDPTELAEWRIGLYRFFTELASIDVNLIDTATFTATGTISNIFTLDSDDTGGNVDLIFGTTVNKHLRHTGTQFQLNDDILINADIAIDVGSIISASGAISFGDENLSTTGTVTASGIINANGGIVFDTITDTIAGIQNQNLLDKTATESVSGLYTWTASSIHMNDDIPITFGNTSGTPDILISYDSGALALNIDLTGVANTDLNITTTGGANTFFIDGQNARIGIGGIDTPVEALDVLGNIKIGNSRITENKLGIISIPSYDVTEEDILGWGMDGDITKHRIRFGGGRGDFNCVQLFEFFVGALNTTVGKKVLVLQEGNTISNPDSEDHDFIFRGGAGEVCRLNAGNDTFDFATDKKLIFRDTNIYINSITDGHLDLTADISLDINSPSLNLSTSNMELRFYEAANYVGFEAPALAADQIWVLPNSDGTVSQVLKTDGSGNLGWDDNASEKSWSFTSPTGSSGGFFYGGFYDRASSANDFNPSVNFGTANSSYAAHIFLVQAAGGSGGTDTVVRITGTSITDTAVRTASDTEDIIVDDAGAAGVYYETSKKWIGQVAIVKVSGPDLLCNYGFAKYWDNNNNDFKIEGFEAVWLAGANDVGIDIQVIHHKSTGWTYNAGGKPDFPTIATLQTDHVTEYEATNGKDGAWKRTNLSEVVNGSSGEGVLFCVITTANKAFELGNLMLRIVPQ